MYSLPVTTDQSPNPLERESLIGVPVGTFPKWMFCPMCKILASLDAGIFELRPDLFHPDRTRYVHMNCPRASKPPTVLPARFLVHVKRAIWMIFLGLILFIILERNLARESKPNASRIWPFGRSRDLYIIVKLVITAVKWQKPLAATIEKKCHMYSSKASFTRF